MADQDERIRLLIGAYADVLGEVKAFAARINARLEELRARFPDAALPGAQDPGTPDPPEPPGPPKRP